MRLPVIVGFGGVNPAGRSSFHHGYRRMVIDALPAEKADRTLLSLAAMMGIDAASTASRSEEILQHTLIRQIETGVLDTEAIDFNLPMTVSPSGDQPVVFEISANRLPDPLPEGWSVVPLAGNVARVVVTMTQDILVPSQRVSKVRSAGQLPTGFQPGELYPSRNHPRGLQMTIFGVSDALGSMGIPWSDVLSRVGAEQISVYAGSGMSQLDAQSNGGMMAARFRGKRVTSKQCPFGFAEMPADFVNAYVLGTLGNTGTSMGACASFLYNLRQALQDVRSGSTRVAIVGNSEAPITADIIEGYAAMGALATDKDLMALDGSDEPNHRRACRPFGDNCGFTLAEASQFVVLFDDQLAVELGANIHGAVADVFVNADGHKKSISAPGVGNYLTVARAVACARSIVGEQALRERSFVQAHGTGTPQNRVTESHILDQVAATFGISDWPVVAVKNYLGHSIGVAAGDQLMASLGIWEDGIMPGITAIDGPADDVHCDNIAISNTHTEREPDATDVAIVNAKGFGGNNATATVLSPEVTRRMLHKQHGKKAWLAYSEQNLATEELAASYDQAMLEGRAAPVYKFDHNVLSGEDLDMDVDAIRISGYSVPLDLSAASPYADWLD